MIFEPVTTVADVSAVRALIAGTADADQQKRGMTWIMSQVCRRLDSPYQPGQDGDRDSIFEMGRHFCGVTIANMTTERALQKAREQEAKPIPSPKRRGK